MSRCGNNPRGWEQHEKRQRGDLYHRQEPGLLYMPSWKGRQTVGHEGPGSFQRRSCSKLQEPLEHPVAGRGGDVCVWGAGGRGQWGRDYKFGSRPLSLRNPGVNSRVRALNLNPAPPHTAWCPWACHSKPLGFLVYKMGSSSTKGGDCVPLMSRVMTWED